MILPTTKQIPENKPRCLLSVTSSVGKTALTESGGTIDAIETRLCSIKGVSTWRRWIESISTWDDNGLTWLF